VVIITEKVLTLMKINIWIKIVIPYTLLLAIVTVAISIITINIIYRRIDERIEGQMERATEVISSMRFLLSDDFLRNTKINDVVGADVIAFNTDGSVIATTIPRDNLNEVMSTLNLPDIKSSLYQNFSLIRDIKYQNKPYKVVYRQMDSELINQTNQTILTLMVSTEDIDQTKRQSAITVILVAISGLILVNAIGSVIAFSITVPVKKLVKVTERVTSGDLTVEADVRTRDEIGILAKSFNQMTRELKASRDKLVQSERLAVLGQIAAGIAHDIRNPLTSVKMIVQLLKRKSHDDDSKESLQVVLDEIDRLEIIVSGLLDFARPMELRLRPANVIDVMKEVVRLMAPNLRHRKIEISIDEANNELIHEVMIDTDRMKQVFMNIILNSMQAMPDGGKIIVRCVQDNDSIQINISDTGIGMSEEVLKHAYDPFFSAKSDGTGLGLTNVKKIIELHGGDIQIDSAENQGTKVIIKIKR
jgi:signal transduction histidine kinase